MYHYPPYIHREEVLARGGNPSEVALRKKREGKFRRLKEPFESRRQERQLGMVAKLLEEEKLHTRKQGHTPKGRESHHITPSQNGKERRNRWRKRMRKRSYPIGN